MSVVHFKRELYDVYVGRPGSWGNLYCTGTREENIAWHREWLLWCPAQLRRLRELRGKVLGCWCHPLPCHGDTLDELANLPEVELEALIRKAEQLRRVHGN